MRTLKVKLDIAIAGANDCFVGSVLLVFKNI